MVVTLCPRKRTEAFAVFSRWPSYQSLVNHHLAPAWQSMAAWHGHGHGLRDAMASGVSCEGNPGRTHQRTSEPYGASRSWKGGQLIQSKLLAGRTELQPVPLELQSDTIGTQPSALIQRKNVVERPDAAARDDRSWRWQSGKWKALFSR